MAPDLQKRQRGQIDVDNKAVVGSRNGHWHGVRPRLLISYHIGGLYTPSPGLLVECGIWTSSSAVKARSARWSLISGNAAGLDYTSGFKKRRDSGSAGRRGRGMEFTSQVPVLGIEPSKVHKSRLASTIIVRAFGVGIGQYD
ncbi:hypothetical protein SCUP234_08044 [Seiridium cupressi]